MITSIGAVTIITHAIQRRKRGRKPSMVTRSCKDPRQVLQQALDVASSCPFGGYVKDTLIASVYVARWRRVSFTQKVNGITITTFPHDMPQAVIDRYHKESERQFEVWNASPAGVQSRINAEMRRLLAQEEVSVAMGLLPAGEDWTSEMSEWLTWLKAIIRGADYIESGYPSAVVARRLADSGVVASQFCGDKYTGTFEAKVGWILGQVLDAAERGMPPHPVMERFVDEARFERPSHKQEEQS